MNSENNIKRSLNRVDKAKMSLAQDMARLWINYRRVLTWSEFVNCIVSVAGGVVSAESNSPAKDLEQAAMVLRRFSWRHAKRLKFAADIGVKFSDVPDDLINSNSEEEEKKLDN